MNKKAKIQELYSIRSEIFNKLDNMPIIPDEVNSTVKNAFQQLGEWYRVQDWYKTQNCGSTIDEYINGNYEETKADISSRRENDRRGFYWGQINHLFDVLEEKISQGEVLSQSEVEKFIIKDDEREKMSVINFIVDELTDKLKDVQMRNRSLMADRGFLDEQISEENSKTMEFIKNFMHNKKDEIAELYNKRENELTGYVRDTVGEIIALINKEESLKATLDAKDKLPYEVQSANSRSFLNEQSNEGTKPKEQEKQSLPTDLIH